MGCVKGIFEALFIMIAKGLGNLLVFGLFILYIYSFFEFNTWGKYVCIPLTIILFFFVRYLMKKKKENEQNFPPADFEKEG